MTYPARPLARLISELSKLPGIGEKTASRLAFHILRSSRKQAEDLAKSIIDLKDKISLCSTCFNLTEIDPCPICQDEKRTSEVVCVVEEPDDLMAIDRAGQFDGKYHVLHGILSPLNGIGPEDIRIKELLQRIKKGIIKEVLFAINPSVEGEATIIYLADLIRPDNVKITRIAYGIPMGGDLKYSDKITLIRAMENRREV